MGSNPTCPAKIVRIMGYLDNAYAQNWIEQLRTNQEMCHPERDMTERMARVDRFGVDVFAWYSTRERDPIWRRRWERLFPGILELIR